jgi:hypothetical protein
LCIQLFGADVEKRHIVYPAVRCRC